MIETQTQLYPSETPSTIEKVLKYCIYHQFIKFKKNRENLFSFLSLKGVRNNYTQSNPQKLMVILNGIKRIVCIFKHIIYFVCVWIWCFTCNLYIIQMKLFSSLINNPIKPFSFIPLKFILTVKSNSSSLRLCSKSSMYVCAVIEKTSQAAMAAVQYQENIQFAVFILCSTLNFEHRNLSFYNLNSNCHYSGTYRLIYTFVEC